MWTGLKIVFFLARKILDHELWISPQTLIHKSNITLPSKIWYDKDILANGDAYFRNISDKCISQVIFSCNVTYECFQPELQNHFFRYALTHQVLYIHLLKKVSVTHIFFDNHVSLIYIKLTQSHYHIILTLYFIVFVRWIVKIWNIQIMC